MGNIQGEAAPFGEAVRRPTPIMCNQPYEKLAFARCPTHPNSFPWPELYNTIEETLIC